MSNLTVFQNSEFGSVRTLIEDDGTVLFCASDVAKILGYVRPNDAVHAHCKHIMKRKIRIEVGVKKDGSQAMRELSMIFIPEGDVYRLIVKSNLPTAKRFEKQVVEEILPSIMRNGSYSTKRPASYSIADPIERAQAWVEEQRILRREQSEMNTNNLKCVGE